MRVRYESSRAEFVAYCERVHEAAQESLPWWRRDGILGAALTAGLLYLGYRSIGWLLFGLAAGAWAYPRWQRLRLRQNAGRDHDRWQRAEPDTAVEVELRAEGLVTRHAAGETRFPWRRFLAVAVLADGTLELRLTQGELIHVSARAFPEPESRGRFIAELNRLRAAARAAAT